MSGAGHGSPRKDPHRTVADRGHDSDPVGERLARRSIELVCPYLQDNQRKKYRDVRKLRRCKHRCKVERTVACLLMTVKNLLKPVPTKGYSQMANQVHKTSPAKEGPKHAIQYAIDTMLEEGGELKVLEAGCGSASHVRFSRNASVTGIDIRKEALASNNILDERIFGDIQTYHLPESEFHLVSCWDVLEHLPAPRLAIANLASSLKPGGLLVLAMPNVLSFEGLLTKLTPHWCHMFIYRYVLDFKDELTPFRTYLRCSIAPKRLERFVAGHGLELVYSKCYARERRMAYLRRTHTAIYWVYRVLARAFQVLSLGMIHPDHSSYIVLLKKCAPGSRGDFPSQEDSQTKAKESLHYRADCPDSGTGQRVAEVCEINVGNPNH